MLDRVVDDFCAEAVVDVKHRALAVFTHAHHAGIYRALVLHVHADLHGQSGIDPA